MKQSAKNLRVCSKGHEYFKSSDCPICPICEKGKQTEEEFLSVIAAPARRALERAGIRTLLQLATLNEDELLKLHGMGPGSIPKLRGVLQSKGLTFRKK